MRSTGRLIFILLLLVSVNSFAAEIITELNDSRVIVGESTTLRLKITDHKVSEVTLNPLDRESVRSLAGPEMDEKELESLLHLSKGNPRKILRALEVDIYDEELEDHEKALLRLLKS